MVFLDIIIMIVWITPMVRYVHLVLQMVMVLHIDVVQQTIVIQSKQSQ